MELAVGEALVSLLDENGQPGIVERALIVPPRSQIGPISAQQRQGLIEHSMVAGVYEQCIDRESAYEHLSAAAKMAPTTCAMTYGPTSLALNRPPAHSPIVTAQLKCPPEILPNA